MAFIFDLDGTLLNSLDDMMNSLNQVLESHGLASHGREAYQKFVGNGMVKLVERACPTDYENKDQVLADFLEVYKERYYELSRPYPGVIEMLKDLNRHKIPIGICTNKKQEYTDKIVELFFNEIDFVSVYGDRFEGKEKPSAHYPLSIAKEMGIKPEQIYFVGDSDVDIYTALNSHMIPVGVSWGFRSVDELKTAGASYIVNTASEVFELLK
ncbi:HAD family hydrolase [Erysipelothrix urinaevulpis]|uniref:HAD family hydrolase n=1 Tax=Erysipelothrix urinaevulpis TaxID=2683717 RepID=UPI001356BBCD|nr:HAD family hydrolase [Erysipelothrix urinaevulpis]